MGTKKKRARAGACSWRARGRHAKEVRVLYAAMIAAHLAVTSDYKAANK